MNEHENGSLERDYRRFIELYLHVNSVVVAAERASLDQQLSMSAVVELRSAFTHIMRVEAVQHGIVPPEQIKAESYDSSDEYCIQNLNKACGHLYRAGHDAYDALALAIGVEIEEMVEEVSQRAIYAVVHEASQTVFAKIDAARSMIDTAKASKDVNHEATKKSFSDSEQGVTLLLEVRDLLRKNMERTLEYDKELAQDSRRNVWKGAAIGVVLSVIATAVMGYGAHIWAFLRAMWVAISR